MFHYTAIGAERVGKWFLLDLLVSVDDHIDILTAKTFRWLCEVGSEESAVTFPGLGECKDTATCCKLTAEFLSVLIHLLAINFPSSLARIQVEKTPVDLSLG